MKRGIGRETGDRRGACRKQISARPAFEKTLGSQMGVIEITEAIPSLCDLVQCEQGGSMAHAAVKKHHVMEMKYQGTSAGPKATLEAALQNAFEAAAKEENGNHFFWKLEHIHGDFGGVAEKTITVDISVKH